MIMTTLSPITASAGKVRDVMQSRVVAVEPQMTVRELVRVLSEEGISGAPVLNGKSRILGVVSATDVMQLVAHEAEIPSGQLIWGVGSLVEEQTGEGEMPSFYYAPDAALRFTVPVHDAREETGLDSYTVEDIMTPVAFSVAPEASLAELVELFLRGRIHRALVVENGVLRGIATPFDVLSWLMTEEVPVPEIAEE